jgi:HEAT repeat protein
MNLLLGYPTNSVESWFQRADSTLQGAFQSFVINAVTLGDGVGIANNRANVARPKSYSFLTTSDEYVRIFSAQCDRVHSYIAEKFEGLERTDEEQKDEVVESIAEVIGLVGEPAFGTVMLEAQQQQVDDPTRFGCLLRALALTDHQETEGQRINFLEGFTTSSDYGVKRAALDALGHMKAPEAKVALGRVEFEAGQDELKRLTAAMLR